MQTIILEGEIDKLSYSIKLWEAPGFLIDGEYLAIVYDTALPCGSIGSTFGNEMDAIAFINLYLETSLYSDPNVDYFNEMTGIVCNEKIDFYEYYQMA